MERIDTIFDTTINHRLDDISSNIVTNDAGYKEAKNKTDELYDELKSILTPKQFELFDKYNEAESFQNAIIEDLHYKQGIKDGYRIRELLDINLVEISRKII